MIAEVESRIPSASDVLNKQENIHCASALKAEEIVNKILEFIKTHRDRKIRFHEGLDQRALQILERKELYRLLYRTLC